MNIKFRKYWRKTSLKKKEDGNFLLDHIKEKNPKNFLEIGVFHGVTSRNVCDLLHSIHGNDFKFTGIDLFTYSPKVIQMDMHDLQFEDNSFDVVYDSWVLKYAYDLPKACSEIIRVLKNNGIIATGYTQTITSNNLSPKGSELSGGLNDLFYHFEPHVNHVYWQEADPAPPPEGNHRISAIFSVTK